jgi:hypothetical protein
MTLEQLRIFVAVAQRQQAAKPNLYLNDYNALLLWLHWVAVLFGHLRADMAVTGGVHTVYGLLKSMMAGAKVAMSTSCLLRYGIDYAAQILRTGRNGWKSTSTNRSSRCGAR